MYQGLTSLGELGQTDMGSVDVRTLHGPLSMIEVLSLHPSAMWGCFLRLCEARRNIHLLRTRSEAGHVRARGLGYQVVVNQGILWCHGCEMVDPIRVRIWDISWLKRFP